MRALGVLGVVVAAWLAAGCCGDDAGPAPGPGGADAGPLWLPWYEPCDRVITEEPCGTVLECQEIQGTSFCSRWCSDDAACAPPGRCIMAYANVAGHCSDL